MRHKNVSDGGVRREDCGVGRGVVGIGVTLSKTHDWSGLPIHT